MTLVGVLNRAAIWIQLPIVLLVVPILAALHGWWIAPIVVESIVVDEPRDTVNAAITAVRIVVLAVGGIVAAACAASVLLLRGSIRHAVEQLQVATDAIASGDLRHRVRSRRRDELGRLAHVIDALAERLERLEQARRRTLACVSHELRTPLTIIQGHSFTLARGEASAHRLARLEIVQREAMQLARLVDDLVEASSLHAGSARLAIERCDLVELAAAQAERFREQAQARELTIELVHSRDRVLADVDPARFGQVLSNLLSNAVRHGVARSSVRIEIRAVRGAGAQREVVVSNRCDPIGEDVAARIFDPFVQGEARTGSVGLGLTIVHALVAAHGGSIDLDARAAAGGHARFAIRLPGPSRSVAPAVRRVRRRAQVHRLARVAEP